MSYQRTHSEETFDEYKTDDGFHRITSIYEDGKFKELEIRFYATAPDGTPSGAYQTLYYTSTAEINQLIMALHAAVATINKRQPNGK